MLPRLNFDHDNVTLTVEYGVGGWYLVGALVRIEKYAVPHCDLDFTSDLALVMLSFNTSLGYLSNF